MLGEVFFAIAFSFIVFVLIVGIVLNGVHVPYESKCEVGETFHTTIHT